MKEAIKNQWVEALILRQDEIDKSPAPGQSVWSTNLKSGGLISPDGILCDLYLKEHGLEWDGPACLGSTHAMPPKVKEWAGLDRHDPILPSYLKNGGKPIYGYKLMTLCLLSASGWMPSKSAVGGYRSINYRDLASFIESDL